MGKMIELARTDGEKVPAYEARAGDDRTGIVVVQEWWGLNDHIKSVADHVAAQGFNAVVPDLYRGKLTTDRDEASHFMGDLDFMGAVKDIDACLAHLKRDGEKAGVMGFCMGGALTIMAGVHLDACDAGVCCYGIPPADAADPKKLRCKMMFHFAEKDDWCTPNTVDALEEMLREGRVPHKLFRYDAEHAFMNASRPAVYDEEKSDLAWTRSLSFFFGALG